MPATSLFYLILLSFFPRHSPDPGLPSAELTRDSLLITYLGNMGVFLASGDERVLIDALHRPYQPEYLAPTPETLAAMIAGKPPFHQLDALLITHIHRDHVDVGSVMALLESQATPTLFGSPQLYDSLFKWNAFGNWRERLVLAGGDAPLWKGKNGLRISSFALGHTYQEKHSEVQNFAYLVEIGGKKILHVGDATAEADVFRKYRLEKKDIDIAILPFWMMESEKHAAVLNKYINAKELIATHLPPVDREEYVEKIRRFFPQASCFTQLGDKLSY